MSLLEFSDISNLSKSHPFIFTRESSVIPVFLGSVEEVLDGWLIVIPDGASLALVEFTYSPLDCLFGGQFVISVHQAALYVTFLEDTVDGVFRGEIASLLLLVNLQVEELWCRIGSRLGPYANFRALVVFFCFRIEVDS